MKQRYKFDIKRMTADCEANYLRICRLLPAVVDLADKARTAADTVSGRYAAQPLSRELLVALPGEEEACLTLIIQDQSRYTSTLRLDLAYTNAGKFSRFVGGSIGGTDTRLIVRMYHDMRLAEVVSVSGRRVGLASYEYPNDKMFQPDEKAQQNLFLAELLGLFVLQGRMASREHQFNLAQLFVSTDSSASDNGAKRPIEVQLN